MDNSKIISIISIFFAVVFWIFIFYAIFIFFRSVYRKIKKKQAPAAESSQTEKAAKEEIKETAEEAVKPRSKLSKILRWRAATWKGKLLVLGTAMILIPVLLAIFLPDDDYQTGTAEPKSEAETYYVKTSAANVRECPQLSCKILGAYPQNTELIFPGELFDKYPDWVEVTFPDGGIGYISKTVLSENKTSTPEYKISTETPRGSGIALGEGDFDPLVVGYSYDISFCVPESARSGATCGGLAGDTSTPVGGSPPYSLVKGSGFFPPGMSLELNGLLSGAPTTEGTYNFQICAKDLKMNQGCQSYTLVVVEEETTPVSQPPITQPPSVAEETPRDVSIISASCKFIGFNDKPMWGKEPIFRLEVSGTVSGPVDSYLSLFFTPYGTWSDSDGQIYQPSFCSNVVTSMDSNWTSPYYRVHLQRKAGEPETTLWTFTDPCWNQDGIIEIEGLLYPNERGVDTPVKAENTTTCSF